MSEAEKLKPNIGNALKLLAPQYWRLPSSTKEYARLENLLSQCQEGMSALTATTPKIRTIHHFACSGGTLISRCIAAQPNTVLLSEIDPLSRAPLFSTTFSPYDILKQSQTGLRPLAQDGVEATFLGGLTEMHRHLSGRGQRLVLRDHTHSHFCTRTDPLARPTLREILEKKFSVCGVITVRHPIDSYVSLQKNNWVIFVPNTFDEYCKRYTLFLDKYQDFPVIKYEAFVVSPDETTHAITDMLELPFSTNWLDLISVIKVTGDSGRRSEDIAPRERRPLPKNFLQECAESTEYKKLCDRLGYASNAQTSPYKDI